MKGIKSMKVGERRICTPYALPLETGRKVSRRGTERVEDGRRYPEISDATRGHRRINRRFPLHHESTHTAAGSGGDEVGCRRSKLEVRLHVSEEWKRNCPPLT